MTDLEKLGALGSAIVQLADADLATFWDSIPVETRPDAVATINQAASKLAALSAAGLLDRILRTHNKETKS